VKHLLKKLGKRTFFGMRPVIELIVHLKNS